MNEKLTKEQLTENKRRFKFLENELIDLISKSDSDLLKDTFTDWMEVRNILNENSLREFELILENYEKHNCLDENIKGTEHRCKEHCGKCIK